MKRKLLSLLALSIMIVQIFSLTCYAASDIEPNDTPTSASLITVPGSSSGGVSMYDKYDYYQFNLSTSRTVSIQLSSSSSADVDLYLCDSTGYTVIASSRSSGSNEFIQSSLSSGNYKIKVVHFTGSPASYNLSIQ